MTLNELHKLIAAGESLTLELKKSTAEKDRACRSLCALANGQSGCVVFGVTPTGKAVGQKVTDRTLEDLAQEFQGFEPPLCPHIQRIPLSGEGQAGLEVLVLQIERATQAPISFRGVPYERVLNTTRVMPRTTYQRLLVEALREALANAFIHRDYASAAGSVSVALYDDRLEIISPGELHFGLTPEILYQPHESKPWNPLDRQSVLPPRPDRNLGQGHP